MRLKSCAPLLLTLLVSSFLFTGAAEPDGYLALRYEWADASEAAPDGLEPGETMLRIEVRFLRSISDAVVIPNILPGIDLRAIPALPATPPLEEVEGESLHWQLGESRPRDVRRLRIAVKVDEGSGGIVDFSVEGRLPDGRWIRETVGVPVGRVHPPGRFRAGALEFPAQVLENENH